MLEYRATNVFADYDDNDVLIIAFGELVDGEIKNSFQIQDTLEYDEQDEERGEDLYYITLEDSEGYIGTYGGIQRITLSATNLQVELDEVGQKTLGVSQIKIDYQIEEKAYSNLQEKMELMFANRNCLKIKE
jgi:hypothetical protein